MKRINWLRLFLMGFATYATTFCGDETVKLVQNEPTVFANLPWTVWGIVNLKSLGASAFTVAGLLMNGYHPATTPEPEDPASSK
jgi:hypothetical protein